MIESYILIGSKIYQEGCNRCSAHRNSSGVKRGVRRDPWQGIRNLREAGLQPRRGAPPKPRRDL